MFKQTIKFIHTLRIFFLVFILVIFLYQLGVNPVSIGYFVGSKFGSAIGMSVSIPENPFSKLAVQLQEREEDLTAREQALAQKEAEIDKGTVVRDHVLTVAMLTGIIILFVLIMINYYLDWRRKREVGHKI